MDSKAETDEGPFGLAMSRNAQTRQRRAVRDSAATRAAILDAAERIFAQKGLHATRTEDIAAASGVTKAMIHYYFTTKENLYQAVLERVWRERAEGMDFESLRRPPPAAALEAFVERLLNQMCLKPHLGPLFALENVQNNGAYYTRNGGQVYRVLAEILRRGIADGSLRKVDARHAAINIIGACVHYFNVSANVRILFPKRLHNEKSLMLAHARSVTKFILNGMRPPHVTDRPAPATGLAEADRVENAAKPGSPLGKAG